MSNRNTAVTITARVAGYLAGMDQVQRKTKETAGDAKKRLAEQGQAFEALGGVALRMGVVAAAGVALAVARFVEFDKAISQVRAATQATSADMELLEEAALSAGASTVFTATEAANAIEELGKAGLTTADILDGGLSGALTLAASSGLGVAEAAQITAVALKQFNLEGDQATHVADLLAAGAGKSVGSVDDLSQALNQAGLIANGAGFSIEETTGVLSAFADAGLLGSDAGTSLKTAIISLQKPTEVAQKVLDKYGISVYDTAGTMLSFEGIAGQLQSKLKGLDDQTRNAALATIFGTDALRVANVLYTQGADGIRRYTEQTNESGFAAKVAADRVDNLAGDVEALGGAFDTALIRAGSGANDVLREIVQSATFLVNVVGGLPEPVLATGTALTVAAAATLLASGGVLTLTGRFLALKAQTDLAGISLKNVALRSVAVGGAIGLATVLIGAFITTQANASASADEFKESLNKSTGALTDYSRELIIKKLNERDAFDEAKKAGITQKELTDALYEGGAAYDSMLARIDKYRASDPLGGSVSSATKLRDAFGFLNDEMNEGRKRFEDAAAASDSTTGGLEDISAAAKDASGEIEGLAEQISNFGKTQLDVNSTNRAFEQAVDDATAALVENGATLDLNTEAGRDNQAALDDIAKSTNDYAAALFEQTGSVDVANAALERGREALINAGLAAGFTREQAELYADQLIATPTAVTTTFNTVGLDTAITKAQKLADAFRQVPTSTGTGVLISGGKNPYGRAAGGAITGPGSGTSDTAGVFALSNGEHVLTAADVQALGGQAGVYAMRRQLQGYAQGGAVQYAPSGPSGGGLSVGVQVINKAGMAVSDLIDLRIQQNGLWQSVDLDGGLTT